VPRHVLESLALAWHQSGELNEEQVRRLLGYNTRLRVHAFLKEHDVPLYLAYLAYLAFLIPTSVSPAAK